MIASHFCHFLPTFATSGLRIYNPLFPLPPKGEWEKWDAEWQIGVGFWTKRKLLRVGGDMPWSNESRQSRGYGSSWEKVRKQVIARARGMCEKCEREGKVAAGRDVDHVVSKAKATALGWSQARIDHPNNLQYLCDPCHKEKTAAEQGRTLKPAKVQIGLDGWPIEKDNAK